jgi:hypothetical protein
MGRVDLTNSSNSREELQPDLRRAAVRFELSADRYQLPAISDQLSALSSLIIVLGFGC